MKKGPQEPGWQKLTFERHKEREPDLLEAISRGGNIGVLLGPKSNRLLALDLDDDELIDQWLVCYPWLANTLRSRGKRGCQFWLRLEEGCDYPNGKAVYPLKQSDKTIGELRIGGAGGAQSVIFGVHPAGMAYKIVVDKPPLVISGADLDELAPGMLFGDEQKQEPLAPPASNSKAHRHDDIWNRVTRYLDSCDPAIEGSRGHDTTFRILCQVINGFSLSPEQAWSAAQYYNQKCEPAWSEKDLKHKVDDALKAPHDKPRGSLLDSKSESETPLGRRPKEENAGTKPGGSKSRAAAGSQKQSWPEAEGATAAALRSKLGDLRCVEDEWFLEKDGVWLPRSRDEFRPQAIELLPEQFKTHRNSIEVLKRLESEQQSTRSAFWGAAKFNTDHHPLISVQNGTLCITPAGALIFPTRPDEGFTIALPIEYRPGATAPLFDRVLCEAVPDEADRELFLDVLATALLPDCRYEAALVVIGEAGTGKSTVMAPMPSVFGAACSSLSMADLTHQSGYKLALLRHRMINLATELNTLELDDSGLFKQLVSGEWFTARPIYGKPFEMCSTATLVFLANSLPRFKSGTDAEVRRLRFVRFDRKVSKPDLTLKDRIVSEAPGIFAELVRRASQLLAGRPLTPQSEWGKETAQRFSVSNDPVGHFVSSLCQMGPDLSCDKDVLYDEFEKFRDGHGISQRFDGPAFFRTLYDRFPAVQQRKIRCDAGRKRVISGIDLNDD